MAQYNNSINPNKLLFLLLIGWWILNLVQGAFMELTDDEAYYWSWVFCRGTKDVGLEWGYFDHPPLVALGVWLSSFLPGTLGVRFFVLLMQPLSLLLFWDLVKPTKPTYKDALTYAAICFAMPVLQLYGLLSLPDAYLLFSTALFLWMFNRIERLWTYAIGLGIAIALLGYSKYHGALVVLFVVLANPRCLKSKSFYAAVFLALLLYLPHLYWQYTHGWPSFQYHLMGRNRRFEWMDIFTYILSFLLIFNPFFNYHFFQGLRKEKDDPYRDEEENMLCIPSTNRWMAIGFFTFFALSSLRGHVQAQWVLPVAFALIWALFDYTQSSEKAQRFVMRIAAVSAVLFILVRIMVIWNPFHFKGEIWNNKEDYTSLATIANGRPVLFTHNYTASAKYTFYTGQPSYTSAVYWNRESQWQYSDLDDIFLGQDILVSDGDRNNAKVLTLPSSEKFFYQEINNFHPLRRLEIVAQRIPDSVHVTYKMAIQNPYPYDILPDTTQPIRIIMHYYISQNVQPWTAVPLTDTLKAFETTEILCHFTQRKDVPTDLQPKGFAIGYNSFCPGENLKQLIIDN